MVQKLTKSIKTRVLSSLEDKKCLLLCAKCGLRYGLRYSGYTVSAAQSLASLSWAMGAFTQHGMTYSMPKRGSRKQATLRSSLELSQELLNVACIFDPCFGMEYVILCSVKASIVKDMLARGGAVLTV